MSKILIIKLGYSETLDSEISSKPSLGDVLRTTIILNAFKSDNVTWLVDEKAYLLLDGNKCISRILLYNLDSVLQLQRERFDTVINFEKVPGVCALADSINAWRRFGFRFDADKGDAQAYDGAERVLSLCLDLEKKKHNEHYWQQALMHIIGREWNGEEYILGYQPKSKVRYDVGFNWAVGDKWPNKAWPRRHWKQLEDLLKGKYSICWQRGLKDIREYIDWLHSCRLIVTNDSLGLHIALALKKKVIVLFGSTSHREIYLYNQGVALLPKIDYDCIPCLKPVCHRKKNCIESISPAQVKNEVEKLLKK